MKAKRLLSFILCCAVAVTMLLPVTQLAFAQKSDTTFESYSASVDFSSYALRPAVYSKWWYNDSWPQTPNVIIRSDAEGTGHWSIPEEEGNKYLRLTKDAATNLSDGSYNNAYHKFLISSNGLKDSVSKLKANKGYRVSFKYRVSNLSDNVQILLSPFDANSNNSENWSLNAGNNAGKLGIDRFMTITSNTDGWETFTGYYTPTADCNALIFRWFSQKTTDYGAATGTGYSYMLDIDDIKIDAVSIVTLKDVSGQLDDIIIGGIPGEKIELSANIDYYEDYDEVTKKFSNIVAEDKTFSNCETETLYYYCNGIEFEPRSSIVDFNNYTLNTGLAKWDGPFFDGNGEVYNTLASTDKDANDDNINRWSIVEENGNKFIRSTKEHNVQSIGAGNLHTVFLVSTDGKTSGLISLKAGEIYKISFKYRITNFSGNHTLKLSLCPAAAGGSLINSRNTTLKANIIEATGNTNGWQNFEIIITPETDIDSLVFKWLGDNYTNKGFVVDTDDIKVENVASVILKDVTGKVEDEVVYGNVGDKIELNSLITYYESWDGSNLSNPIASDSKFTNIAGKTIYYEPPVTTVKFVTGEGAPTIADQTYSLGEQVDATSIIPPAWQGHTFSGWYYEAEYGRKATTVTCDALNIMLYARWDAVTPDAFNDFENSSDYRYEAFGGGNVRYSTFSWEKNEDIVFDGSTSIKYDATAIPEDSSISTNASAFAIHKGDKPVIDDTRSSSFVLKSNTTYSLSYWYRGASSNDTKISVVPGAYAKGNYNAYNKAFTAGAFTITDAMSDDTWKKAQVYFTTDDFGDSTKTALFLKVNAATKTNAVIWLDNITIEEFTGSQRLVSLVNKDEVTYYKVNAGDSFTIPNVEHSGYKLVGWFSDSGYKKPVTDKTVKITDSTTFYTYWVPTSSLVDFENYPSEWLKKINVCKPTTKFSNTRYSSANTSYYFNETKKWAQGLVLMYDSNTYEPFTVAPGYTYSITFNYYCTTGFVTMRFNTGNPGNMYSGRVQGSGHKLTETNGQWKKMTVHIAVDRNVALNQNALFLYFDMSTEATEIWFDDIEIKLLDNVTFLGYNYGYDDKIDYVYGKEGEWINLPTPKRNGYRFLNWCTDTYLVKDYTDPRYQFLSGGSMIYAKWAKEEVTQDFENVIDKYELRSLNSYDFDYKFYYSKAAVNTADNSHSGSYSLHRIGDDYRVLAFQPLNGDTDFIASGQAYELSMWVKMDSYKHTDGAIKMASCNSEKYPWSVVGEWQNICAIKDLTDGKWHEIKYTFIATDRAVSFSTPGNLSIYFDDIKFTLLPETTTLSDCSKSVEVNEYNVISPTNAAKASTILNSKIDKNYFKISGEILVNKVEDNGMNAWLIVGIIAASVLVIGGVAVSVFVIRKKKGGK